MKNSARVVMVVNRFPLGCGSTGNQKKKIHSGYISTKTFLLATQPCTSPAKRMLLSTTTLYECSMHIWLVCLSSRKVQRTIWPFGSMPWMVISKKKKHALDGDQLCVHQTRHVARGLFLITQYVRLAIKYYSILTN
jgi:hypothetical protein